MKSGNWNIRFTPSLPLGEDYPFLKSYFPEIMVQSKIGAKRQLVNVKRVKIGGNNSDTPQVGQDIAGGYWALSARVPNSKYLY
jgi:hypothetical protein